MYSESIEKLIKLFSKFPTIGPRVASRFVFYLIHSPTSEVKDLLATIAEVKNKIKVCSQCLKPFEPPFQKLNNKDNFLCEICSDKKRNQNQICVVEKEMDLEAIEKTGHFHGVYFLLGNIHRLDKNQQIMENKARTLTRQIKAKIGGFTPRGSQAEIGQIELIIALNPTPEGQNASLWLRRRLEGLDIKVTSLGLGMPLGGELEYADEATISSALERRR